MLGTTDDPLGPVKRTHTHNLVKNKMMMMMTMTVA